MDQFKDKRVVVTGAGRGIGLAVAEAFAAEGARVAVLSRNEQSCGQAAAAVNAKYSNAVIPFAVDVADYDAMQVVGKEIVTDFEGVDILINNAGITRDGLLLRMTGEDWDAVMNTNLKGAFNAVKAFQRPLMKSGGGLIINVSSVIGLIGNAGQANYAASKAGIIAFSKSLAIEYAKKNINVNCVSPGFIKTEMTDKINEEFKKSLISKIPSGDLGTGEDVSNCVAFLASDMANYINGETIHVNGGMYMA